MNSQLFVVSNATQTRDISELLPGQLGIYATNKQTYLLENAGATTPCDRFLVAVGKTKGSIVNSRDISVASKLRERNFIWKKDPYRAPTESTFNLSTNSLGQSAGDEFEVKINTVSAYEDYNGVGQFFSSWSVFGTFDTYQLLYEALANDINSNGAEGLFFKSAVASSSGVLITSNSGQRLNIVFLYHPDTSDKCVDCKGSAETRVEQLSDGDIGSGTPDSIRALAARISYWNGGSYSNSRLFTNTQDDYTISDTTRYVTYMLRWTGVEQVDESQTEAAFNQYQTLFVAAAETVDLLYFEQVVSALVGQPLEISTLL